MLGGVKTAIQVAAALLGVLTGVGALTTGGDVLLVIFWIGVVSGVMLASAWWFSLPFMGARRAIQWRVGRKVGPEDWPWYFGSVLSFGLGLLLAYALVDEEKATERWGFWHWYGSATLAVVVSVGVYSYWKWQGGRHTKCDDCASTVPVEARVCKYCRYEFETPAEAAEAANTVPGEPAGLSSQQ
jgi:hypothetical protein